MIKLKMMIYSMTLEVRMMKMRVDMMQTVMKKKTMMGMTAVILIKIIMKKTMTRLMKMKGIMKNMIQKMIKIMMFGTRKSLKIS